MKKKRTTANIRAFNHGLQNLYNFFLVSFTSIILQNLWNFNNSQEWDFIYTYLPCLYTPRNSHLIFYYFCEIFHGYFKSSISFPNFMPLCSRPSATILHLSLSSQAALQRVPNRCADAVCGWVSGYACVGVRVRMRACMRAAQKMIIKTVITGAEGALESAFKSVAEKNRQVNFLTSSRLKVSLLSPGLNIKLTC